MDSKLQHPDPATTDDEYRRPLMAAFGVVILFHLSLLLAGSYRSTYDAWVHIFFGDHYQRNWFSTWEPRWYTGFSTVSYPPGTHQILASLGSVLGLEGAFVVAAAVAMAGIVIGTYRSAQLWVDRRSAAYAALLAALSSSLAETLHTFGQLPTLVALAFALNGLPFASRWVRDGNRGDLAAALAFAAATTAVHHVTTLFGIVFILAPVLVRPTFDALRNPPDAEPVSRRRDVVRRLRRAVGPVVRSGIYLTLVVVILVVVVLPYWLYSRQNPITQIPIPHGSRENFIAKPNNGLLFFAVPWGVLLLTLPYAAVKGMRGRAWPLMSSVLLLTLLGTGGTTPIPRMLLGGAFEILTLDRFTLWATILILPVSGQFISSLTTGGTGRLLSRQLGERTATTLTALFAIGFAATAIFAASLPRFRALQPATIDMAPIVSFLEQDRHEQWRYLTLGFGDQMAHLGALTTAETVDGNYHSARRLPELTSRPIERLEGAKFTGVAGLGSLQQFLQYPDKFHLKFVFSNDKFYDPLLWASGWQELEPLSNGIHVWQRDDVRPLPPDRVAEELPAWQRTMWGTLPPLGILAGLVAGVWAATRSRRNRFDDAAARAPGEPASSSSPPSQPRSAAPEPIGARRRAAQRSALVAVGLVGVGAVALSWVERGDPGPAEVVYDYYDALDLREVERAFEMIDPRSVASRDQYMAEYRRRSGLVSSFARLESMSPPTVTVDGDRATVVTELTYLTPFQHFTVATTERLRRDDGRWMLEYTTVDQSIPPDPFTQSAAVDYTAQGRRQPSAGLTVSQDVLDRPTISAGQARLVEVDGELSVVGEIANTDAVPGYITVFATLVGHDGTALATQTNGPGTQFTLLPEETGVYRINFEGVAGATMWADVEFDPVERTTSGISADDVASVDVRIQSLTTSMDLERNAEFVDVTVDEGQVSFDLFNSGSTEITIAEFFVALRDETGQLRWVVNDYSPSSVGPRRSAAQVVALPPAGTIRPIATEFSMTLNDVPADSYTTEDVALSRWSSIDLSAMTFLRRVG